MAQKYAKGSRAWGICGRSGRKMLLKDMVFDGRFPNMRVDPAWYEDKHPQEYMPKVEDPTALYRPSPEVIAGPSAPVLTASLQGNDIRVTWTPAETGITEIASYTIFRGVDGAVPFPLVTCAVLRDFLGGIIGVERCTTTPSVPADDTSDQPRPGDSSGSVFDKVTNEDAPITYIDLAPAQGHTYCYYVIANPMGNNQSVAQGPPSSPSNTSCITVAAPSSLVQFTAVGDNSTNLGSAPTIITRNPNTSVWTQQDSSSFSSLNGLLSVARALGMWVLGTDSNAPSQIGTSLNDFVSLLHPTNPNTSQNFFAAGGDSNIALLSVAQGVLYSPDGVAWAQSNLVGPGSYFIAPQGIAAGGGIYAATGLGSGNNNNIFSSDGITWQSANYNTNGGRAIIHDGTQFVQVGASLTIGSCVAVSVNGSDFTESAINLAPPLSIAFNGSRYVAIERISSNLISSASIAGLASATPQAVATGNFTAITADRTTGLFCAVDDAGYAYTSDGVGPWTRETTPITGTPLNAIAWNSGGTFVPIASSPVLSGNLVAGPEVDLTWTAATITGSSIANYLIYRATDSGAYSLLTTVSGATLAFNDTTVVNAHNYHYYVVAHPAVGRDSLKSNIVTETTPGGVHSWARVYTEPGSGTFNAVTDFVFFSASRILAVGDLGTLILSTDGGTTWNPVTPAANSNGFLGRSELAYNGSVVVITTTNALTGFNVVSRSTDQGATWTLVSPVGMALTGQVVWSPLLNLFVSPDGGSALMWTSPDGLTWTSRALAAVFNLNPAQPYCDRTEAFGKFVWSGGGSGHNGQIVTSADGVTWNVISIANPTFGFQSVCFDGTDLVVTGNSFGHVWVYNSTDASVWNLVSQSTVATTPPFVPLVATFGGKIVNCFPLDGSSGIATSSDHAATWSAVPITTAMDSPFTAYAAASGTFFVTFAGGLSGIASTTDLAAFTDELDDGTVSAILNIKTAFGITLAGGSQNGTSTAAIWKRS